MMKPTSILPVLFLISILAAGCQPIQSPASPVPTLDSTTVAIAAEATVTAMAGASQPQPTLTPQPPASATPAETAPTLVSVPQTSDFWVTYLSDRKLAVMNGDGSRRSFLTNTPGSDYYPVWSPNGQTLAFIRFDATQVQDGILHLLPAGSNTPTQVDPGNLYGHLLWLPDNRTIVASRNVSGAYEVYLVDTVTGQPTEIARGASEYPLLSPDAKKLLLLLNTGPACDGKGCTVPNDIFVYDIATRQKIQLTGDSAPKGGASWSPDGSQIAYLLVNETGSLVEIIGSDGTLIGSRQEIPWWKNGWQRSPDGTMFAYVANWNTPAEAGVFIRPSAGGDPRQVASIQQLGEIPYTIDTLRWRPDGSGLVFNSWITLYTVNVDGSDLRTLPVELENIFFDVRPAVDPFNPPPVPTPPAAWNLCPGGKPSRLDIGRIAEVSTNPPAPNNVRIGPDRRSDIIGQISPGEKVEITGRGMCDNGMVWWEIKSLSSGLKGYTLEGDADTYWLVPVP